MMLVVCDNHPPKRCLLADVCPDYNPENVVCRSPLGGNICDALKELDDEE